MGIIPLNLPKEEADDFVRRCFKSFYDTETTTVYIYGETWGANKELVKNIINEMGVYNFSVILYKEKAKKISTLGKIIGKFLCLKKWMKNET